MKIVELSKGAKVLMALRQELGLPPNACVICGNPVQGWDGEPPIASHAPQPCPTTKPEYNWQPGGGNRGD